MIQLINKSGDFSPAYILAVDPFNAVFVMDRNKAEGHLLTMPILCIETSRVLMIHRKDHVSL
jgi:hypothetical protein